MKTYFIKSAKLLSIVLLAILVFGFTDGYSAPSTKEEAPKSTQHSDEALAEYIFQAIDIYMDTTNFPDPMQGNVNYQHFI